MAVSPVQNYSEAFAVKTTYDVTQKINLFLNRLCLSGVIRNAKNEIVKSCGFIRFIIFFLSYVAIHIACSFARSVLIPPFRKTPWGLIVFLDVSTIWVAALFILLTLISVYRTKLDDHQEYYTNYASIDSILNIKSKSGYSVEKIKLDRVFFITVAIFFTKVTVEPILLWTSRSHPFVLAFTDHVIGIFVMFIIHMSIITKLMVFRERFRLLVQEVTMTLKEMQGVNNNSNAEEKMSQFKQCYQLLYKQNFISCKLHGWQILLILIHLLLFLTRATYSITAAFLQHSPDLVFIITVLNQIMFSGGTIVHLATIIEKVSDLRIQLLMLLEAALVCLEPKIYDKEEYRHLGQLLAQVRRQPLEFFICNMYCLDYKMLQSVISFVVTYTVVLAQLNITY